jgi:hypothetical protein
VACRVRLVLQTRRRHHPERDSERRRLGPDSVHRHRHLPARHLVRPADSERLPVLRLVDSERLPVLRLVDSEHRPDRPVDSEDRPDLHPVRRRALRPVDLERHPDRPWADLPWVDLPVDQASARLLVAAASELHHRKVVSVVRRPGWQHPWADPRRNKLGSEAHRRATARRPAHRRRATAPRLDPDR